MLKYAQQLFLSFSVSPILSQWMGSSSVFLKITTISQIFWVLGASVRNVKWIILTATRATKLALAYSTREVSSVQRQSWDLSLR